MASLVRLSLSESATEPTGISSSLVAAPGTKVWRANDAPSHLVASLRETVMEETWASTLD